MPLLISSISSYSQYQISVSFNDGFVGIAANGNSSGSDWYLSSLGWSSIKFLQNSTSATLFIAGAQGNDVPGNVIITDFSGTTYSIPGALNWRSPSGNNITMVVFIPATGVNLNLVTRVSPFTYNITPINDIGLNFNGNTISITGATTGTGTVSGNAAGILNAINTYLGTIPSVVTSTTPLTTFSACSGSVSTEQSFTVSGTGLTASLVVTAPTGYEVSTTSGGTFSTSVSFTPVSGSVTTKTIYVRLASTALNGASGNIVSSSSGAVSSNIATGAATVNPNLPASVSIGASATSICSGTSVIFTATPTNGGAAPSYQWKVNGSIVGSNSATYTTSSLANNDIVTVVMTSNASPCLTGSPATSNTVTMTVNPTSVAGSISGATTICSTTNSTILTLNDSVGTIKWQSSDVLAGTYTDILGAVSATYTVANLTATTYYRAIISSGSCATATTNSSEIKVLSSNIWTGATSTAWNDTTNWSCGVPSSGENIEIPAGLTNYPVLDQTRTIGNVIIASGATLNLNNSTLVVSGVFSGTGTLIGSATSGLNLNGLGSQGTFYMNQTTPGTSNKIANFTLNATSSGSATLGNDMSISGILTLTNGTFNTSGKLTLTSNGSGTAVVAPITDCNAVAITGDVTVERFFPARRAFRLISSPVTTTSSIRDNWQEGVNNPPPAYTTNLNPNAGYGTHITGNMTGGGIYGFDATQTTANSMFTFNNTTRVWVAVPNTNSITLTAGVPYRLMIRGDRSINMSTNAPTATNTILRAKGELKICNAPVGILGQNANDLSFIGNPYQATVDIKAVLTQSSNINSNFYQVWDPTVNTRGGYVNYDFTLGRNTVLESDVNQYLQPWQACFVKTSSAGLASITFNESNKSTSVVNENVYRTNNLASYIRLTLYESNTLANNGVAADGLIVKFGDNFDNAIDENDSLKINNQDETFSTKNNTSLVGIEGRLFPVTSDVIPLNITQYRFTNYTMVASGTNMSGLPAYLHDQLLQTYTEIPQSGSVNYSYVLDTNNAATSASDRFRIVFQNPTLSIESNADLAFMMYPNPSKQGVFDVVMNDANEDTELIIFNTIGQEVYATNLMQSNINHINPNKYFAKGVYYVKIKKEATTTIKKLIIE